MTKFTKRDILWDAIIRTARHNGKFSIDDVREMFENIKPKSKTTPAYDTIRDCLRTLKEIGYVSCAENEKDEWKITRELLNPNTVFNILASVIEIGVENESTRTGKVLRNSSVESVTLVTLSLEVLEQQGFVQRRSEVGRSSKWQIMI